MFSNAALFERLKVKVNNQLARLDETEEKFYLSSPLVKANKIRDALGKLQFALELKTKLDAGTLKTYHVKDEWDYKRIVEVISVSLLPFNLSIYDRENSEKTEPLDILVDNIRGCNFSTEEAMLDFSFLEWTDGLPANYAGSDDDGIRPGFYSKGSLKMAIDAPRFMGSLYTLFFDTETWDAFSKDKDEKEIVADHTATYKYPK